MKILSVLLVGLAALASPFAVAGRVHHKHHSAAGAAIIDSSNIAQAFADMAGHSEWQSFKALHRKSGYESAEQEQYRYAIFQSNMARAAELHKLNPEANFGMNKFSDLHPVEFKNQYLNFKPITGLAQRANLSVTHSKTVGTVPADFDWRSPDGNRPVGVTAVKDQGQCGSCWAFSATEEVESAWILAGNKPVALAPEQTVDCDTVDGGCNGGDTTTAYRYMQTNGVQSESSYPYTAGDSGSAGTCAYNRNAVVAKISGFTYATPGCTDACDKQDEAKLKTNLYNVAPASICVDASTWQTYTSGILTGASGCQSAYSALDHCVQLVGFGVDSGTEYWSVRNSWASDWGEQGYIRLSYGANTCGVADEATFVTI